MGEDGAIFWLRVRVIIQRAFFARDYGSLDLLRGQVAEKIQTSLIARLCEPR